MLKLDCREAGFDCDGCIFEAHNEAELNEVLRRHVNEVHGVDPSEFTPELARKVKANVHRV